MADPVTIVMIGAAITQRMMERQALKAEARDAAKNESLTQRALEQQGFEVQEQTAQQMTDRMAEAARRMSMARVMAAEGVGSLESQATNIEAGKAEDLSRIQRSGRNQLSTLGDQRLTQNRQTRAQMSSIRQRNRASQVKMVLNVATAAAGGYMQAQQAAQMKTLAAKGATGLSAPGATLGSTLSPTNPWYTPGQSVRLGGMP